MYSYAAHLSLKKVFNRLRCFTSGRKCLLGPGNIMYIGRLIEGKHSKIINEDSAVLLVILSIVSYQHRRDSMYSIFFKYCDPHTCGHRLFKYIVLGPPGCAQVFPYLSPGPLDFFGGMQNNE